MNVEGPMLRSFRKYAESGSIPADTLLVRLAVAQHHRLPTRVLDWTVSPKVALHFATAEEEHYDKDGVVWCVHVRQVRDLLPIPLQSILDDELAFLFSVEMLPELKTLKDLDSFGIKHGGFALFFEPPSLDARIVNQGAIMSVMPGARLCLNDFLESYPQIYRRIVVPNVERRIAIADGASGRGLNQKRLERQSGQPLKRVAAQSNPLVDLLHCIAAVEWNRILQGSHRFFLVNGISLLMRASKVNRIILDIYINLTHIS